MTTEDSSENERRRNRTHHFALKHNPVELSIIVERADEDGSINQHSPDAAINGEMSGKSANGSLSSAEGGAPGAGDSSGTGGLFRDEYDVDEPGRDSGGEDSSEKSLQGFEQVEKILQEIPTATKLKILTRFRSFDYPSKDEIDSDDEEDDGIPAKKFGLKEFREEMQSKEKMSIAEDDGGEDGDDETIVPDDADDDFDVEAAIERVLSEATPEDRKTAWEKLQDSLQRVPRRKNMFDLFYESDEDVLKKLFRKTKNKLQFHFSESSADSSDTL
ncbi:uncharacterized protein LOC129771423 [Toxorhynchites rutilus septentrionalis]|uniref:uncharacterized protein LOC129771423 n=1 Tax=Toxorhynchites rutilus septentrionalis TaxID=329112 RepID=UPI0024797AD5|nr:uncharacterized protein LOC129771423 [Toxorhynchites rutilus septentrionalis]